MSKRKIPLTLRASYVVEAGFLYPVCICLTVSLILSSVYLSENIGKEETACTVILTEARKESYIPIKDRTLLTGPLEALEKGAEVRDYCISLVTQLYRDFSWGLLPGPEDTSLRADAEFCSKELPVSDLLYLKHIKSRKGDQSTEEGRDTNGLSII